MPAVHVIIYRYISKQAFLSEFGLWSPVFPLGGNKIILPTPPKFFTRLWGCFLLRNLFHVSFLAKLITVVWLLYTSSPHPKHFALHIAYTCQHSYFPVKVQLTLKNCLKLTLMCFIKWNSGYWGRSPRRLCPTSETSVKSIWSWNKQIGGLLCSCKLSSAHFSQSML